MFAGLLITVCYSALVWLVFFRLKLIKFSIGWGIASAFIGVHVLLIFLIGLRFVTPSSTDAKVVQQTLQLIPRLPEPTLVTAVLVEEGAHVAGIRSRPSEMRRRTRTRDDRSGVCKRPSDASRKTFYKQAGG